MFEPSRFDCIFSGFIDKTDDNTYYRTLLPVVIYVCESVIYMCMSVCAFLLVSVRGV